MRNALIVFVAAAALAASGCGLVKSGTEASGLTDIQKVDLKLGTGAEARAGTLVTVNYTVWLWDKDKKENKGDRIDSSVGGTPFSFLLGAGEVIPGWDEGVVGMRVDGIRRLVVPPELAYGSAGYGAVPPNATLVFEVQLLSVQEIAGPTSLQILDLRVGTGAEAVKGKKVAVYYTGWIYQEGQPDNKGNIFSQVVTDPATTFTVGNNEVIAGIDQGIVGMKVGGLRRMTIPPALAWGSSGSGTVPAYATVIFEIQLNSVTD